MNTPTSNAERRRLGDGWNPSAVLLGLLLVAAVLWLLPRRVSEVAVVDGGQRWAAAEAPPRRQIVWRPADSIAVTAVEAQPEDSLVRPHLADGGLTLYYTLKRPDAEADIYRSRFDGRTWLPGEPVPELNSAAGDYGPVISADGTRLFLYSNRPGGQGGYDLFVSQRAGDGWTEPVNLGPAVNTPAHEYDPAISPDGTRLFFASNRSPDMVERLADAAAAGREPTWNATLRADVPLQQFDIHVATFDAAADRWRSATPLPGINSTTSNEGEPCVSPDGAFLYFTSDRPNASGAGANYDIYRVRLAVPGLEGVENLGIGVNTSANEHDPAFSPEGFRIVFSSDRDGAAGPRPDRYALYVSRASETIDEAGWSTAHLDPLARHWWWILLLALLLGLVASLVWYVRDRARRRAPVPVFFLVALVLHFLMLTGAFFVPIEGVTVAERIKQRIEQIVASEVILESSPAATADAAPAFEQVAQLESVEAAAVTPAPRQTPTDPTMPLPAPRPVTEFQASLSSEQVTERAVVDGPVATQAVADPRVLRRQQVVEEMVAAVAVELASARPGESTPSEAPVTPEAVQVTRSAATQPVETARPLPVAVAVAEATPQAKPAREAVAVEKSATAPAPTLATPSEPALPRAARSPTAPLPAPGVETIAVVPPSAATAATAAPPVAPSEVDVRIDRAAAVPTVAPAPAAAAAALAADEARTAAAIQTDRVADLARPASTPPLVSSGTTPSVAALPRATRAAPAPLPAPGVETIAIVPRAAAAASASAGGLATVSVEIARTATPAILRPEVGQPLAAAVPGQASPIRPAGSAELGRPDVARADMRPEVRLGDAGMPLARQKVRSASLLYAQEAIGLRQMLQQRGGDDVEKRQLIEQFGGRPETLEAIERGLHWLAMVQWDDGRWELHKFPSGPAGEKYTGMGGKQSPTAGTALALLPFLGDGHTPVKGRYAKMVDRGIEWLVKNQKPNGDLYVGPPGDAHMYSHGIATIALCEAFGMAKEDRLQKPAQAAIDFIVAAQHAEGGWRYKPGEPGDLSVMGWQLMALKSGQMAGLAVPTETLDKARKWLEKARKGREFCYTPGKQNTPAMTAEGLLCMEYLGTKRDAPEIADTIAFLLERLPSKSGKEPSYYAYYGTQALFHVQGEPWRQWNAAMSDTLLATQVADGIHQGTWDPTDNWEQSGGRIYATALRLLMLEVYFRHLPLYQVLE